MTSMRHHSDLVSSRHSATTERRQLSYGCSTSPIDSGIESEDARFKWVGAGCFAFALLSSAAGLAEGATTDVAAAASAASGAAAVCAVFACVEPAPVPFAAGSAPPVAAEEDNE